MKRESAVRRQRPWRRGPDQRADINANPELPGFLAGNNRKLHPDRWAGVVFVLHFRFGQSGAVVDAPVHRFQSAVNVALFEKCEEGAGHAGFITRIHGEVGLFPLAENAEPLKFASVRVDVACGKFPAHAPKLSSGHFACLPAQFLFDLGLYGQAVAIPAGNIRSPESGHGL